MTVEDASSLDRGMTLGYAYAQSHQHDRSTLGEIARSHSAADVRANVHEPEAIEAGTQNPVAFWSGFAHGVGRYLIEEGHDLITGTADLLSEGDTIEASS